MPIEPAQLQRLAQWFSGAYPVGSYAYSHGLETMIAEGRVTDAETFRLWLSDVLMRGAGWNDALLLCAAFQAKTGDDLAEVADLARALAGGRERLAETLAQGAAFGRVTGDLWQEAGPDDATGLPYPVAVGAAARGAGLPLAETVLFFVQAFAQNLCTVAARAIPIGATEAQAVLARLAPEIATLAGAAVRGRLDDIGGAAVAGDLAALRHETQTVRIFRT